MPRVKVEAFSFRRPRWWSLTRRYPKRLHTLWTGDVPVVEHVVNIPEVRDAMAQWDKGADKIQGQWYRLPGCIVSERRHGAYQEALGIDRYGNFIAKKVNSPSITS